MMKRARFFTAVEQDDAIDGKLLVITDLWYSDKVEVKRTKASLATQAIKELESVGIEVIRQSKCDDAVYLVSDDFLPNIITIALKED